MSCSQRIRDSCGRDFDYLTLLAHLVVAENQELCLQQMVWHSAISDYGNSTRFSEPESFPFHWYGRFLGSVIRIKQGRDVKSSADSALETFVAYENLRLKVPICRHISYGSLVTHLSAFLTRGQPRNTNPHLYDRYLSFVSSTNRPGYVSRHSSTGLGEIDFKTSDFQIGVHACDVGYMLLRHPSGPRPDFLLAYFQEVSEGKRPRFLHPKSHKEALFQLNLANELELVLKRKGRLEDAKQVAEIRSVLAARRDELYEFERGTARYIKASQSPNRKDHDTKRLALYSSSTNA